MSVRALFHCSTTVATDRGEEGYFQVTTLDAAYGPENAAWSHKPMPTGTLSMTVTNPEAASAFVAGRDYWIDITPVDAPPIQVGDVIDPVPEAGHEGPQYVTAVTEHPDGTALDLRPATPGEIAAAGQSTLTTHDGTTVTT